MTQYDILQLTPAKSTPIRGQFYRDNDGDLVLYLGEGPYPWMEFNPVRFRAPNWISEPLTEVPDSEALNEASGSELY